MAKSIRSKWKRKMRAVKRKKNAVKELVRLKRTVEASKQDVIQDVVMSDLVVGNFLRLFIDWLSFGAHGWASEFPGVKN